MAVYVGNRKSFVEISNGLGTGHSTVQPVDKHSLAEWQRLDAEHLLHPFTDHRHLHASGTRVIVRSEGIYIWDAHGRRLLDAMSGLQCVNLGYSCKELIEAATNQLRTLPYYNSFFQCTTPPAIELASRLAALAPHGLGRVFFTGSGSEGNDTALRMVRHYWALAGEPRRTVIIARENAYHGSTVAGVSLGGMGPMRAQGGPGVPDIVHIAQPYWFGLAHGRTAEQFGLDAARELEAAIEREGPERVAAFFAEPVQGAGGAIIPPDSYWPEIQRICRRYGVLLVADEVICGFGRTGHWFGSQRFGIEPDLMIVAKGLSSGYFPIGAVLVRDTVAQALIDAGVEFAHGFTNSGHPVGCAVAIAALEVMQREHIVERVREEIGPYLAERWGELADHPLVGETRMCGLIGALELVRDAATRERFDPPGTVGALCRDLCLEHGVVLRGVRDTMIVAPPLILQRREADELVERTRAALDATLEVASRRGLLG
jgi:putrescine aminotransferase